MKSDSVNTGRFCHSFKQVLFLIGLLHVGQVWAINAPITAPSELRPTAEQNATAVSIMRELKYHYKRMPVDDRLSQQVFDRFLEDMDSTRSYFLSSDIQEFQKYRSQFDNYLLEGKLDVPFLIFNRYQLRSYERVQWLVAELETNLSKINFESTDELPRDRSKEPWPATKQEADRLWQHRLKDELLKIKLSGKTTEQAADKLLKRFRNQLRRASQTNSEDAFQLFMNSVAQIYDPHTNYFSPRAAEDFSINMSLQFAGIGAELVAEDEYVKVARLIEGSPAQKTGKLKPADRIIGVAQGNGEVEDVVGWRLDDVVAKIRGPVNTTVRLQIIPANSESEDNTQIISITRSMIKLEDRTAKSQVITLNDNGRGYKLGVIEVPSFYSDFNGQKNGKGDYTSATRDVAKHIIDLKKQKVDGVIIDLRNNGGGSLQEAISMVGLFIETGPAVQVRSAQGINSYTDDDPSILWEGPLAVLVNRLSASASEIFAGAIQDYHRGLVLGDTTYGKGTVQAIQELDHGELKLTMAKFYRISGQTNQHTGVIPDISFPSLLDPKEIGESSQPNALPADSIPPARYRPYNDFSAAVGLLRNKHVSRISKDPDFQFLAGEIELLNKARDQKLISLNEDVRQRERKEAEEKRLKLENARRVAKGEKPYASFAELKASDETLRDDDDQPPPDTNKEKDKKQDDFYLTESAHILIDLLALPRPNYAAKQTAN